MPFKSHLIRNLVPRYVLTLGEIKLSDSLQSAMKIEVII